MSAPKTILKPCPFCGGDDILFTNHGKVSTNRHHRDDDVWSMGCYDCGASFPNRYKKQLLVDCWNKRVDTNESALDNLTELVKDVIQFDDCDTSSQSRRALTRIIKRAKRIDAEITKEQTQ